MKKLIGVVFLAVFATGVWAEEHEGGGALDFLSGLWADPTAALYTIEYRATRHNRDEDGNELTSTEVHHVVWRGIDYASWLVAERGILDVQARILEAWAEQAAAGDEGYKKLIEAYEAATGGE